MVGVTRGFQLSISQTLMNQIFEDLMGLPKGTLHVRYVTGEHWNSAYRISAITNDDRFPIVPEGNMYPLIVPLVHREAVYAEDGVTVKEYRVKFEGFNEVNPDGEA